MIGRTVAALLLWLALPAAWAAERIHGADAHFASADVALEWAVLRHPDEERTEVVIRVVDRSGRGWHLLVEGVDPFGGARTTFAAARPVRAATDIVVPRRLLADHPSLELHFSTAADALAAGRPAFTVYYLGVPDTTPEFLDRVAMEAYLAGKARP